MKLPPWLFSWPMAALITLLAFGILYQFEDLRVTKMEFNRKEAEERAMEVEKRAKEREKREREIREKRELEDKIAEALKREEQEKRKRDVIEKVEDLRDNYEKVELAKQERLEEIEDTEAPVREVKRLQELANNISENVEEWVSNKMEEETPVENMDWMGTENTAESLREEAQQYAEAAEQEIRVEAGQRESEFETEGNEANQRNRDEGEQLAQDENDQGQAAQSPEAEATNREMQEFQNTASRLQQNVARQAQMLESAGIEPGEQAKDALKDLQSLISQLGGQGMEVQPADQHLELTEEEIRAKAMANRSPEVQDAMSLDLDESDMADIYQAAENLEEAVEQAYTEARAAEMAQLQGISVDDAMEKLSNLAQGNREDLSEALENAEIGTIGDLNQYRETLNEAMSQMERMRVQTQHKAQQLTGDQTQGRDIQLAQQSSRAMAQQAAAQQQQSANSSNQPTRDHSGFGHHRGYAGTDNRSDGGQSFEQAVARANQGVNERIVEANALPGRKFDEESARQGWLFIDTWHIIGPWENNGKIDYTNVHPPELEIDLDAVYPGKIYTEQHAANDKRRGEERDVEIGEPRKLRWVFTQNDQIRMTMPDEQGNSTYYAYTEIYFEKDRDMLVAIATDDAAKVWLNKEVIWEETGLSPWRLGENFKRISFKAGYNPILVRLENGPSVCQFSLLICPPEYFAGESS